MTTQLTGGSVSNLDALSVAGAVSFNGGGVLTLGTSVATTAGTAALITGVPSWVKRITLMFNGFSTAGTSDILVQIGAGSVTTTGYYSGSSSFAAGGVANSANYNGFNIKNGLASRAMTGHVVLTLFGSNQWVCSGTVGQDGPYNAVTSGRITLGGTLDRVNITSVSTDTFNAGSVNILYEG